MQLIEIHWTTSSIDEARRVSRYLVQEKLVACSQIIPWIESVFIWNDQLDTAQESKVVFKTLTTHFEAIKKIILENTQYEVPEITSFIIDEVNAPYKEWLLDTICQTS
ncbi:divalent-cation tolerance protein CutA [Chlamydiales bacterium]|nr:divalent-cation tolerance protein CutA [Chlamydiales bacterium]